MSEPSEIRYQDLERFTFEDLNRALAEHPIAAELVNRVSEWLQLTPGSPDTEALEHIAPAVIRLVSYSRARRAPDGAWHPDTWLGAVMLAARLVRRRNSPAGIDGFTADGAVAYVRSNDPDVAVLLRLNAPAIG